MKVSRKLLVWTAIIGILIGVFCYKPIRLKADSGWDSSYDGGGGGWSSSSWDSGWSNDYHYSSSSSSSVSDGSPLGGILFFVFLIILIFILTRNDAKSLNWTSQNYMEVSDEILKKYGIDKESFKKMVYDKYVKVQNDWTNFNYEGLQKNLTDELYNTYMMQLDALKIKKQKNIMSDFDLIECKIIDVKDEHGLLNVNAYLRVTMFDYVVDENNKVLRGKDNRKMDIEYIITMVKTRSEAKETRCPNCGAEIDAVASGKCGYCGSIVVVDAKDYVMSKKTCVGQRMR